MAAPLRVLLVDDSAEFVEGVRALLDPDERLDVVGVAGDGEEAVALAERLRPDLVLMDIGLPRIDGVEATRAIRDRCPGAQVVMLTGRHERADELGSGEAGAVGFLHKEQLGSPRLADELLALVELS
ncbi:MAG TPA: response regulator transcription factor [Gaiellaceae bacterium]|nr:response regulator transcription factor [Gaiellaceae bacterium]